MANPRIGGGTNRYKGQKLCAHCGEAFWWHPKMRMTYCSNRCRHTAESMKRRPFTVLDWRTCGCGEVWLRKPGVQRKRCLACYTGSRRARSYQPVERGRLRDAVCCKCGVLMRVPTKQGRYSCAECRLAAQREEKRTARRRRKARQRGAVVVPYLVAAIYERDRWMCQICRKRVVRNAVVPHPKAPTIDHIVPLALGGRDAPDNVQCAHFLCNSRKGTGGSDQLLLIG